MALRLDFGKTASWRSFFFTQVNLQRPQLAVKPTSRWLVTMSVLRARRTPPGNSAHLIVDRWATAERLELLLDLGGEGRFLPLAPGMRPWSIRRRISRGATPDAHSDGAFRCHGFSGSAMPVPWPANGIELIREGAGRFRSCGAFKSWYPRHQRYFCGSAFFLHRERRRGALPRRVPLSPHQRSGRAF